MSKAMNHIVSDIYIGKGAGNMILDDMLAAKSCIQVMSPYLSAGLVDVLLDRKFAGVHIELVTSDDIEDHKNTPDKNSYKIIRQHQHIDEKLKNRKEIFKWVGIGLIILFGLISISKLPSLFSPFVELSDFMEEAVFIAIALIGQFIWKQSKSMKFHSYSYSSLFPIKIFYSYFSRKSSDKSKVFNLHSKLYIIDNRIAYLGSVNFTKSGQVHNHETRIRITDPKAISQLKEEFEELLNNDYYNHRSVNDWGRELYETE